MKKILLLLFMYMTTYVLATQQTPVEITDFSLGLNTTDDVSKLKLGEGTDVHNVDLSKSIKRLVVREGFDSLFTINGIDSFLWNGLAVYRQIDGNKRLLMVGDSLGVDYANVYASNLNSVAFNNLDSFFYEPETVDWVVDTTYDTDSIIVTIDTITCYDCEAWWWKRSDWCTYLIEMYGVGFSTCQEDIFEYPTGANLDFDTDTFVDTFFGDINSIDTTWSKNYYITIRIGTDTTFDSVIVLATTDVDLPTLAEIIDSIVPDINGGTHAALLTAARDTDTLIITEDEENVEAQLWVTSFSILRQGGLLEGTGRVATYFPTTGVLSHVQYRENVYFVNGVAKGLRFDGRNAFEFPMRSPSELSIIPLNTTGGQNGTYRYMVTVNDPADDTDTLYFGENYSQYLSAPVVLHNHAARISYFPYPTAGLGMATGDSLIFQIWRTTGDAGVLDQNDTVWKIAEDTITTDSSGYDDKANILIEIDKILSELGVKHLVLGLLVKKE